MGDPEAIDAGGPPEAGDAGFAPDAAGPAEPAAPGPGGGLRTRPPTPAGRTGTKTRAGTGAGKKAGKGKGRAARPVRPDAALVPGAGPPPATGDEPSLPPAPEPTAALVPAKRAGKAVAPAAARPAPVEYAYDDGRRLKKAQQTQVAQARAELPRLRDAWLTDMVEASARDRGGAGSRIIVGDVDTAVVLPGAPLAWEYLTGLNGFLLDALTSLAAPPKTGKSGLLAEIGRWFYDAGGAFCLAEVENKFNSTWYRSILGADVYKRGIGRQKCDSIEDWQEYAVECVKFYQDRMVGTPAAPGPGRVMPVLIGVDSLMAKMSRASHDQIVGKKLAGPAGAGRRGSGGEGSASRGHPVEAMLVSRWMKAYSALAAGWPVSLVTVNHVTHGTDMKGKPTRSVPGGSMPRYLQGYDLEMARAKSDSFGYRTPDFDGYPVRIRCVHSAFTPAGRQIEVRLLWWFDRHPETGAPRQVTLWDWHHCLVHTLDKLLNDEFADPMVKKDLKAAGVHVAVTSRGDVEHRAWSRMLGMREADACPWDELGLRLGEDPACREAIRDGLHVDRRQVLDGCMGRIQAAAAAEAP